MLKIAVHVMRAVQWQGHILCIFWYDVHFKLDVWLPDFWEIVLFLPT